MALHTTSYGRPAVELLRERIAAVKGDDPLRPVTVVVPTNYVGVSARRLLASGELGPITGGGAGVAGLTLVTVYRLAELLGAPRLAAEGRRPLSTPVVAAAVRRALADEPGVFAPVRDHPATEEALVRAYRELSEVRTATLDTLAAQGGRAADVVRVRRAARGLLEGDWFEEADLMAAAEAAVAHGSPVLGDLGTVLCHLPQDLSLPAAGLLATLARHLPVEVLAGRTGAAQADADVDRTLRRLGLEPPAADVAPPTANVVVSVSDAEEEAREATQRIVAAARAGVPLERMAVLYPAAVPYARLVAEQFDTAGVPYNGRAVRPLTDRLLGRWLLDLLALPDRRYARPAVMGLLAGAPVRDADGRWVATGAWERVSREAGIVRDLPDWNTKLPRLAADLRHRADLEEADDDGRDWLVARHRRTADEADALHAFVGDLFDRLTRADGLGTWRGLVDWSRETLRRYLGGDPARQRWPEVERDAADRVEEALDRLAGLDHVEARTDLGVFRRTLELELDDDLGRVGEFGKGVLVGTVPAGLGVDLDLVVVLGLAEGVFPTRPREDSLLPDSEREAAGGELRLRVDRVGVEHRQLLAALASSGHERVLTCPRGDLRRSVERVPSRWLLDTAQALSGPDEPRALPPDAGWHRRVASFARRVHTVAFPATRQEYGLRALADSAPHTHGRLRAHPLVAGDTSLRRGVDLALARGREAFGRFDGNIGELAERLPTPADGGRVVSATSLETWLGCPHAYFMQHVLRIQPVENPDELVEIDPLEKGSLVHDVLEAWLDEQLADGVPAATRPWPDKARARLRALAEEACEKAERRGVTGHPLLWHHDRTRIQLDLERFVDADDERRERLGLTPVAAEQPFGVPGSDRPPVTVGLGDGRTVEVRGRIDRIDRRADGGLVVVDYKTGRTSRYGDLKETQPLGDGTKLQLAIYGLAAAAAHDPPPAVRSEYWFVSTRGDFARKGYELTGEVVDALSAAVRLVTDGIAAGHFPMRPPAPGWRLYTECSYCDPDELGTSDRHRDWERVRRAPALRDYVAHIEPDALDDGGADR